jgi:hypothetical protein
MTTPIKKTIPLAICQVADLPVIGVQLAKLKNWFDVDKIRAHGILPVGLRTAI